VIINAQKHEQTPSIEITPVIDMVFLLLIFFLVATTYQQSEREMQIALPEAEAAGPISAVLREIVINIGADGSVVVGGAETSLDGLRAIVSEAVERNPEQKVSVRGDREASYGVIARVLDVCKGAGVGAPFLDTVPLN
jgi:biopolymer transport protein ExbD